MLKLTLLDFQSLPNFSDKIEAGQVLPFAELSLRLDITPLLGFAVLEAVDALADATLLPYALGQVVTLGTYVVRRERVFRALLNAPLLPPPIGPDPAGTDSSAQWAYEPLLTLWTQYLKPYWLRASYGRFLSHHGTNLTKAGMTQPNDGEKFTFVRAPSADRAALQAAADSTAEALRSQLTAFLRAESQAHALSATQGYAYGYGVSTCGHSAASPRARLRGIHSNRRRF